MAEQQGLVIVNTGHGKGKTTAALGLGIRAWGQGLRVLMIQFIKGNWTYGELTAAKQLGSRFVIRPLGEGFVRKSRANESAMAEHRAAANAALKAAREAILSNQWDMIILDEINYALKFEVLDLADVIAIIDQKPPLLHLVLTGRDAKAEIIEKANLVTEMKEIKHPYKQGIKAQKGIEF